jgi:hypothetical protein
MALDDPMILVPQAHTRHRRLPEFRNECVKLAAVSVAKATTRRFPGRGACRHTITQSLRTPTHSGWLGQASRGDFDPDVTRQMKPKDYTKYVKKLIAQHGQEALFTGDSNEDRTVWRALFVELKRGARRYLMLSAASLFGAEVPFWLKVLFFCFLNNVELQPKQLREHDELIVWHS